jgi:hypothetical protein
VLAGAVLAGGVLAAAVPPIAGTALIRSAV